MKKNRPPIVVVLGHVDHGKTTLLTKIRQIAMPYEYGEITQSIGAFQAEDITFIDTPGHKAFASMRAKGAKGADIAVVVIAADEGVKEQTREAIKIAQNANIPVIITINKIDKPAANIQRTKEQFPECLIVETSAKTGQGIDQLLEAVLLQAKELDLKIKNKLEFDILETNLSAKRGLSVDLIVKNSMLNINDSLPFYKGKIKRIENWVGKKIDKAEPGMPVRIFGLKLNKQAFEQIKKQDYLNIVIKAKTQGSLEAILQSVQKMKLNVLSSGIGDISDNDMILKPDLVFGFGVKVITKKNQEKIKLYDIIYKLIDDLEKILQEDDKTEKEREELGRMQIIAVFKKLKDGMIVGGPVIEGKAILGSNVDIIRQNKIIGKGLIKQLEHKNRKLEQVDKGKEAGIYLQTKTKIKIKDILQIWQMAA
ncbi:MAG: GTP-binding protein [bacterium]